MGESEKREDLIRAIAMLEKDIQAAKAASMPTEESKGTEGGDDPRLEWLTGLGYPAEQAIAMDELRDGENTVDMFIRVATDWCTYLEKHDPHNGRAIDMMSAAMANVTETAHRLFVKQYQEILESRFETF